ncbi:MAG TPA: thioredoxin domain-containing protein [Chitinophagaceae bacterium]|nr:thioredoxin domain-containing protein [Chitinophagaceae bacterium]
MNKLIHETSPYLLQHAHNPVNWYPWGQEALQLAKDADKPLLVSIGYSACHWCHVMEKESFEDESTAQLMNEYFVNIKIDREERPDLDHIYMDAVQTMTGSGGWPLNVFLTPQGKPFYGGTYFPPARAYNRASWKEILLAVHEAYRDRKEKVLEQAESLTAHLLNANNFGIGGHDEPGNVFTQDNLRLLAENLLLQADTEWGGFGRAPKFPQTFSIQYLLRHYHYTGHQPSLQQALLSLDRMIQGGIYDHLAGGFARYSTDTQWLAPHFEKMLYDNALLLTVLSEAYQLTKNDSYLAVITQTMDFLEKEMLSPENGFYSALDADSEGVEGKYYVWSRAEIDEILKEDSELFCAVYDITSQGNWEHINIIWLPKPVNEQIATLNLDENAAKEKLKICREKLIAERAKRTRPGLDDKILTGWNGLAITACCNVYAASGLVKYLQIAENCMQFMETKCRDEAGWKHTYKNGIAKYPAFLDDCACIIQAYIALQEVTGNQGYLVKAKQLADETITAFSDEEALLFYFTPAGQQDIAVRKKEVYDGATPSGNTVMAYCLYYLSVVFDIPGWRTRAEKMVASVAQMAIKYPVSFGRWAAVLQNITQGMSEIAIVGADAPSLLLQLHGHYIPGKVIQSAVGANGLFPLLNNKPAGSVGTWFYLCRNYQCSLPVASLPEFFALYNKKT